MDFSTARPDILVLIGTQTGNSETVAEDVADELGEAGFRVRLVDMADAYPEMLAPFHQIVVCTSTWGDGELPDNAVDFHDALDSVAPDLSHVAYGVVALGDHLYDPHFCTAARTFEALLDRLGATRVHETLEIDGGPSARDLEQARAWALGCAAGFAAALSGIGNR